MKDSITTSLSIIASVVVVGSLAFTMIYYASVAGATPLQGSSPLLQGGERQTLQVTVDGKTLQGSSPRLQGE